MHGFNITDYMETDRTRAPLCDWMERIVAPFGPMTTPAELVCSVSVASGCVLARIATKRSTMRSRKKTKAI